MQEPASGAPRTANIGEFSVSELAGAIKRALEEGFGYVRLRGEISGYRGPHASGHCYFGLKDEKAKIDAVIWRHAFAKLRFRPEEGMEVIAHGKVTTYPGSSKYQIVIETLEPAGIGALMALLEERKRKFAAEGLFDETRKKPLPFLPRVVGIITSPTGAVIRDMLHGFEERFPTHVVLWPVRVQGETSASEVANAVHGFNAIQPGGPIPRPDVIIVARGGGSLEDLWGFNDEIIVRAVAASTIPVISAVGHETDWTLIDLVADARAPTPTKAAEWAVPKFGELIEDVAKLGLRITTVIRRVLEQHRTHIRAAGRGLPRPQDLTNLHRQHFDAVERRLASALVANTRNHAMRFASPALRLSSRLLTQRITERVQRIDVLSRRCTQGLYRLTTSRRTRFERLAAAVRGDRILLNIRQSRQRVAHATSRTTTAMRVVIDRKHSRLESGGKLLDTLSYRNVLARGYAVVRDRAGHALKAVGDAAPGQSVTIELSDGLLAAVISGEVRPVSTSSSAAPPSLPTEQRRPRPTPRGKGQQGTLF